MHQEDVVQAVVLADSFNNNFIQVVSHSPLALLPVAGIPLINYSLEWLSRSGVDEVILFCCNHVNLIKEHIKKEKENQSPWTVKMEVQILSSETCQSMGDAMRELDAKGLIRGCFILTGIDTISNVPLLPYIDNHKQMCKKDKGVTMTLLYKTVAWNHRAMRASEPLVIAADSTSRRVLFHQRGVGDIKRSIHLPLELLLGASEVDLHHDLLDTNIAICSPTALHLFSDNFDFQTRDDFIKGILINEEFLSSTIYWAELKGSEYSAPVSNWHMYQTISRDVIHHWAYPIVPDMTTPTKPQSYLIFNNHVYKDRSSTLGKGCELEEDVIIANGCTVGEDTKLSRVVIGENCHIGKGVIISDSFIMSDTAIGDKCRILNSFIGSNSTLKDNVSVTDGCILSPNSKLDEGVQISSQNISSQSSVSKAADTNEWDNDSNSDNEGVIDVQGFVTSWNQSDDEEASTLSDDVTPSASPAPDDANIFLQEVMDSLARGYEEKLNCDYLVLEINSSRYAYNMQLQEVNYNVIRALLNLPPLQVSTNIMNVLKDLLTYFKPIFLNYIKTNEAMMDCLKAVEESCMKCSWLEGRAGQVVHLLYERDLIEEEVLLQWFKDIQENESPIASQSALVKFIDWLNEASEESVESD